MGEEPRLVSREPRRRYPESMIKGIAATIVLLVTLAGCSTPTPAPVVSHAPATTAPAATVTKATPKPKSTPTPDPVAAAITDRYGDCLVQLGFTKPFTIDVFKATKKATVSGKPGVVTFSTGTTNTGGILTVPVDTDNSARALASVGC